MSRSLGPLAARLALLGFVVVIVQVTFVGQLTLLGTTADLLPICVAAVGLTCGPVAGAVFGFCVGLLADTALLQDLGLESLLLLFAGYGAGRLRELRSDLQGALVPMVVAGAATAFVTGGYAVLRFLLGLEAPISFLLLRQILATIVVNAVLALPLFALVRRWLAPVLPDDRRRRRRRATLSGGLSPLSRT